MISGSWNNYAIIWKTEDINELKFKAIDTIRDSKSDIEDVSFNRIINDTIPIFAIASSDNHIYLYKITSDSTKFRIPTFAAHRFPVRAVEFGKDKDFYSIDKFGNLKKWNYGNTLEKL